MIDKIEEKVQLGFRQLRFVIAIVLLLAAGLKNVSIGNSTHTNSCGLSQMVTLTC
jgi:hypothetical protein